MAGFRVIAAVLALTLSAGAAIACSVPNGGVAELSEITDLTNTRRSSRGLPPLRVSRELTQAAQDHACHMARTGTLTHTGRGGSSVGERVSAERYQWRFAAENVAEGYPDGADVMSGWISSPGHRQNIDAPEAREIGMGLAVRNGRPFWVMVLAAPL